MEERAFQLTTLEQLTIHGQTKPNLDLRLIPEMKNSNKSNNLVKCGEVTDGN